MLDACWRLCYGIGMGKKSKTNAALARADAAKAIAYAEWVGTQNAVDKAIAANNAAYIAYVRAADNHRKIAADITRTMTSGIRAR